MGDSEVYSFSGGISEILQNKLKGKEAEVAPNFDIKAGAVGSVFFTNEVVPPRFFEAVQSRNPNGYIVGVGLGNIITLLDSFPQGSLPKGIILADTDPKVILMSNLMCSSLRESTNADELIQNIFGLTQEQFVQKVSLLTEGEQNEILKQKLVGVPNDQWIEIYNELQAMYGKSHTKPTYGDGSVNIIAAIKNKFDTLKKLESQANIATVYADFTSPALIEAVTSLPSFKDSRNIIYLSNIVDQVTNLGVEFDTKVGLMNPLKKYEESEQPPIYVDSLISKSYYLRANEKLPEYSWKDVNTGVLGRDHNPKGLLFGS